MYRQKYFQKLWTDITVIVAVITICVQGVTQPSAKVAFEADVNFSKWHKDWSKTVGFEVRLMSSTQFARLCEVNIKYTPCKPISPLICYCSSNYTIGVYLIVNNAPLHEKYSRAEIRGYVKHTGGEKWYSEVQRYPTFCRNNTTKRISAFLIIIVVASIVGLAIFTIVLYLFRAKLCRYFSNNEPAHSTQIEAVGNVNSNESNTTHYAEIGDEDLYETIIDGHPSTVGQQSTHSVQDGYLVIIDVKD